MKSFLTDELIQWDSFVAENEQPVRCGFIELPVVYVLQPDIEGGKTRWEHIRQRVIEHKTRVSSKCYSKTSLNPPRQLVNLSTLDAEEHIGKLVSYYFSNKF